MKVVRAYKTSASKCHTVICYHVFEMFLRNLCHEVLLAYHLTGCVHVGGRRSAACTAAHMLRLC
jgi:hypothetical protein